MEQQLNDIISAALTKIESVSTRRRRRLGISTDAAVSLLRSAYEAECRLRGSSFVEDDTTLEKLTFVAQWLTSDAMKPSLLLYGGVGNGKTTAARAVQRMLRELYDSTTRYLKDNAYKMTDQQKNECERALLPVPRIETAQAIATAASEQKENRSDTYDRIKRSGFLIIDDLGCEPTTVKNFGTEITPVTDILYIRYDALSPTIITTNLDRADIRKKYGARVADRFNETFELIGYENKSYRK